MRDLEEDGARILIIDDDEGSCKTLKLIFEKKGFKTETARTGLDALKMVKNNFFNVVLLDIKLPDIQGIDLLTPLKEIHPDMEVLMVTAYATLETAVRALNEGASAFITKPLNMDEVLAIISKVLEKQRLVFDKRQAEESLKLSELKYRDAYDRANFYKDIFTHDVNNILQNLLSSLELLQLFQKEPKKGYNINELMQIFEEQLNRAMNLVCNVRKLSDLEENVISIKKIEAYQLLRRSINYLTKTFNKRVIDIKVNLNKEIYVKANELLIDVFENILINAVKYNESRVVEISIKVSEVDNGRNKFIKFEFTDNGIGIEDLRKDNIFKRNSQISKGGKGMGLGLSLVKKIITNYNGKIWVEDKVKGDPSKGSNFILLIPKWA